MAYRLNKEELLKDRRLREKRAEVLEVLTAALEAVEPRNLLCRHIRLEGERLIIGLKAYNLKRYANIFVVGGGKASGPLAQALEELLGGWLTAGVVNTKYGYTARTKVIKLNEAGHPLPDEHGLRGMEEIKEILTRASEDDLVIFLISGGGSALLPLPAPGITLEEKRKVTELLLRAGATIDELNAVRKHLSAAKGGQLARLAYPAEVIALILSDVVGDPLETIASGPTAPDPTTFATAYEILNRYDLWAKLPSSVRDRISRGKRGELLETPKPGDPIFSRVYNLVIGNNRLALEAARSKAEELGFNTLLLSTFIEGEAREVGKVLGAIAKEIASSNNPIPRKALVLAGGETTVTVRGQGKGGRNQELALSAALAIAGLTNTVIAALATDGTDGPTDGAGGLVDGFTIARAEERGLNPQEHLKNNDSYTLLSQTGDLILTGPTNTNVNDLMLIAVY
jgi:glycerate-2-kinase